MTDLISFNNAVRAAKIKRIEHLKGDAALYQAAINWPNAEETGNRFAFEVALNEIRSAIRELEAGLQKWEYENTFSMETETTRTYSFAKS